MIRPGLLRRFATLWLLGSAAAEAGGSLPPLNADVHDTTVSGLSSGAFMAVQFHLAHASIVRGAGILAGGPWGCARGDPWRAVGECMKGRPDAADLARKALAAASAGDLDAATALSRARLWLFSGTNDGVVRRSVMDALDAFYRQLAPQATRFFRRDLPAGHAMITESADAACDVTGGTFVTDCDYDAAGHLLQFLYGRLDPPANTTTGTLERFDQSAFAEGGTRRIGMLAEGYVFVPKACRDGARCRVHVALHGCEQSAEKVGEAFVRGAGYNRWADTNRIVVLYPQARSTWGMPWNPYGCWDWWGYTGKTTYLTQQAPQIRALRAMVGKLASGAVADTPQPVVPVLSPAIIERSPDSVVVAWHDPGGSGELEISAARTNGSRVTVRAARRDGVAVVGPLEPSTDYDVTAGAPGEAPLLVARARTPALPPPCDPWFGTNTEHVSAGRAYLFWGRTFASGTHEDMGWWNPLAAVAMHRTASGYAVGPCRP